MTSYYRANWMHEVELCGLHVYEHKYKKNYLLIDIGQKMIKG